TDKKVKAYKDVKDQIKQTLTQQKAKPIDEVLNNLNKNANIEVKDDDFKDVFKVKETPKKSDQGGNSSGSK
ncbi:MAG TPA: hypothetical protein VFK27_07320, partial [Bacillales bacterium]|nr:hypothetical protein [Bacillales bacterium]